jgi:hypothetical protein
MLMLRENQTNSLSFLWLMTLVVGLLCGCQPESKNQNAVGDTERTQGGPRSADQSAIPGEAGGGREAGASGMGASGEKKSESTDGLKANSALQAVTGGIDGENSDPPASSQSRRPAVGKTAIEARALLEVCLRKYQQVLSYEDSGQLVIRGATTLRLPLQVAWERPNRLALRTGSLDGCWNGQTWEARSKGLSLPAPFPNQRLVRPLPERIDSFWLADDSLGGLLTAPMSKPIQLELLLANEPTNAFTSEGTKLTYLEPAAFDRIQCERVFVEKEVSGSKLEWVLWIDPATSLLRKIELPVEFYYPNAPPEAIAGVQCSIELMDVKPNTPIDWTQWKLATDVAGELAVRRWVAAPPIASTPILGKVIEPLDFKTASGTVLLDTAEPKRPLSILMWVDNQPSLRPLVDDLMSMRRTLVEKELSAVSDVYLVSNPADQAKLTENFSAWKCDLGLAVDQDGSLQKAFSLPAAPALIILDRDRRVQVAEFVVTPEVIASVPSLVARLRDKQDLASRQLQQDADNQGRYIAALHRVAIDKEEASKLPEIPEFQFSMHGMRREWKVDFKSPLISANGVWSPRWAVDSLGANSSLAPESLVMAALDEDGSVYSVQLDGVAKVISRVEPEQADGAKRIITSVDPWTNGWIAIVPEGLPRFWLCPTKPASSASVAATTYSTQAAETPVAHAWIPGANDLVNLRSGKPLEGARLAIGTSAARMLVIDPKTEQRLDGTFRENPVAFVPELDAAGRIEHWDVLYQDASLHRIPNLTPSIQSASADKPLEARLDRLPMRIDTSTWYWGMHPKRLIEASISRGAEVIPQSEEVSGVGGVDVLLQYHLGRLASGETGLFVSDRYHRVINQRPLTVRPEQAKVLGTVRLADGMLFGVATGPNRVLHLFTGDLRVVDQVSFRGRVLGAALLPKGGDLQLIVAMENEVSCWHIDIPDPVTP